MTDPTFELWLVSIEPLRSRPKKKGNSIWTSRPWDYRVTFEVDESHIPKFRISVEVGKRKWHNGNRKNHPTISDIESEARAKVHEIADAVLKARVESGKRQGDEPRASDFILTELYKDKDG